MSEHISITWICDLCTQSITRSVDGKVKGGDDWKVHDLDGRRVYLCPSCEKHLPFKREEEETRYPTTGNIKEESEWKKKTY